MLHAWLDCHPSYLKGDEETRVICAENQISPRDGGHASLLWLEEGTVQVLCGWFPNGWTPHKRCWVEHPGLVV